MDYEYSDFFTVSDMGAIAVSDRKGPREAATEWQARIKPWLFGSLAGDRTLAAALFVQDPLRTSRLGPEDTSEAFGCKTYPYCGTVRRESAPLGLKLLHDHAQGCLQDAIRSGKGTDAIEELMQVVKRFAR